MASGRVIWAVCLTAPLAACQPRAEAVRPIDPPANAGPEEALPGCVASAGISGKFETEIFYDAGRPLVSVIADGNVTSDQADAANACLGRAA